MLLKSQEIALKKKKLKLLTPQEIFQELSKYVYGQEEAKKVLSTVSYNHYKKIVYGEELKHIRIEKSNTLLIGKSGSGKTLLVETLSKILGVPYAYVDATTITANGYVGEDATSSIAKLFRNSNYDVEATEMGIIFIDEFDKLKRSENENDKDVGGIGAQQAFLTILDKNKVQISANGRQPVDIRTDNIWFILAGACSELPEVVMRSLKKERNVFTDGKMNLDVKKDYAKIMKHLTNEHLEKYGFIPEILGRVPNRIVLNELTENDLVHIMLNSKNGILKQYENLLKLKEGTKLEWTEDALNAIAKKAIETKTGARGLKAILEKILMPAMFSIPSMLEPATVLITKEAVENESGAVIIFPKDTSAQSISLNEA